MPESGNACFEYWLLQNFRGPNVQRVSRTDPRSSSNPHEMILLLPLAQHEHASANRLIARQARLRDLGNGIYTLRLWYGFMDQPNILRALAQCRIQRFHFNLLETAFIIGREKLVPAHRRSLFSRWRQRLFVLMSHSALDATEFFRIPPNRVVELGGQIEL